MKVDRSPGAQALRTLTYTSPASAGEEPGSYNPFVRQTIFGLLMVAVTAGGLYGYGILRRNQCKCPYCGRRVSWDDINCRHCGDDMKMRQRLRG